MFEEMKSHQTWNVDLSTNGLVFVKATLEKIRPFVEMLAPATYLSESFSSHTHI